MSVQEQHAAIVVESETRRVEQQKRRAGLQRTAGLIIGLIILLTALNMAQGPYEQLRKLQAPVQPAAGASAAEKADLFYATARAFYGLDLLP